MTNDTITLHLNDLSSSVQRMNQRQQRRRQIQSCRVTLRTAFATTHRILKAYELDIRDPEAGRKFTNLVENGHVTADDQAAFTNAVTTLTQQAPLLKKLENANQLDL